MITDEGYIKDEDYIAGKCIGCNTDILIAPKLNKEWLCVDCAIKAGKRREKDNG